MPHIHILARLPTYLTRLLRLTSSTANRAIPRLRSTARLRLLLLILSLFAAFLKCPKLMDNFSNNLALLLQGDVRVLLDGLGRARRVLLLRE